MTNPTEPFGRQPQPVRVVLVGEPIDVEYYRTRLIYIIENGSYDICAKTDNNTFTIYPRAVND
jgi:hypothetical protein